MGLWKASLLKPCRQKAGEHEVGGRLSDGREQQAHFPDESEAKCVTDDEFVSLHYYESRQLVLQSLSMIDDGTDLF